MKWIKLEDSNLHLPVSLLGSEPGGRLQQRCVGIVSIFMRLTLFLEVRSRLKEEELLEGFLIFSILTDGWNCPFVFFCLCFIFYGLGLCWAESCFVIDPFLFNNKWLCHNLQLKEKGKQITSLQKFINSFLSNQHSYPLPSIIPIPVISRISLSTTIHFHDILLVINDNLDPIIYFQLYFDLTKLRSLGVTLGIKVSFILNQYSSPPIIPTPVISRISFPITFHFHDILLVNNDNFNIIYIPNLILILQNWDG